MSDSLTFRLLRYIKASAETLNFTRAAEQIFVAQSSLSHQIGKLEDNIDVAIFNRLQNGLQLTPAGRIVAVYAENTLRDWDQMLAMARAVQRNEVPPLRLGFSSFINAKLLEKLREGYEGMFSGCAIQLMSGDPLLSLQRLDARTLGCAILPLPIDTSLYSVQQIAQSPLVVCMRSDDALADRAQLDIQVVASRLTIFRDPELQPPHTHVFWKCSRRSTFPCISAALPVLRERSNGW
ncbi:LysR family transcriptional regulator [Granulicella sp. S190]|uniref:LysR family transcriptional regulator n=1 Tax=Granulicella sp. S190 TaxID=1747226 RepID=UPI00131C2D76|nr:LysR family transcriptional regulator [Granulicella sp. S190]